MIEYAHSKINLALEVKDAIDGYHIVNNLMIPIELHDIISLEKNNDIIINGMDIKDNICYKAAKLFIEKYNCGGVKISIEKNIPIAAGLAGGSTDAAAVLRGMNKLYNINASNKELEEIAKNLGSDVPFFIEEKFALCTNRGEIINKIDINYNLFDLILIKPKSSLLTKDVYNKYIYDGHDKLNIINEIINNLKNNNSIDNLMFNDLAIPALSLNKEMKNIYDTLINNKYNVHVSGSGPTMYILDNNIEGIKELLPNDIFICKTRIR